MATSIGFFSLIGIIYSIMYSISVSFDVVLWLNSIWRQLNSPSKMIDPQKILVLCIIFKSTVTV